MTREWCLLLYLCQQTFCQTYEIACRFSRPWNISTYCEVLWLNPYLIVQVPASSYLNSFSFLGYPLPKVTWKKSGQLIDETYQILSNGTVRNEITFHSIERSFLRTKLTCEASNTNLTRPTSTTVNVDMNCKLKKKCVASEANMFRFPVWAGNWPWMMIILIETRNTCSVANFEYFGIEKVYSINSYT